MIPSVLIFSGLNSPNIFWWDCIRVETQYLVPAIRQFSAEVECSANGLLMFSTVFDLEKELYETNIHSTEKCAVTNVLDLHEFVPYYETVSY